MQTSFTEKNFNILWGINNGHLLFTGPSGRVDSLIAPLETVTEKDIENALQDPDITRAFMLSVIDYIQQGKEDLSGGESPQFEDTAPSSENPGAA